MKRTMLNGAVLGTGLLILSMFSANAQWSGTDPITTGGKVGIGPVVPTGTTSYLHISNPNTATTTRRKFLHTEWVSNTNFQIDIFGDGHSSRPGFVQMGGWNTDARLGFVIDSKTNVENGTSTNGLFINPQNGGVVGIGKIAPEATLDLYNTNGASLLIGGNDPGNPLEPFKTSLSIAGCSGCHSLVANQGDAVLRAVNGGKNLVITNNGGAGTTAGDILFVTGPSTGGLEKIRMKINSLGKVSIGDPAGFTMGLPGVYKLYVADGIMTERLKVAVKTTSDWSDYVFDSNYKLASLEEVKSFIETNKHLPNVPSSEEVVNKGIDVATMDATLLRKIEELTLYVLQQQKEIDELKNQQLKK